MYPKGLNCPTIAGIHTEHAVCDESDIQGESVDARSYSHTMSEDVQSNADNVCRRLLQEISSTVLVASYWDDGRVASGHHSDGFMSYGVEARGISGVLVWQSL